MASICAEIDAHNKTIVYHQTFGHLVPEARKFFPGYILFAYGCHGDIVLLDWDFGELEANPWLHHTMTEYVGDYVMKKALHLDYGIWRFEGTYHMQKNGYGKFRGKIRPMRVVHRFAGKSKA